jgi:hypothetical protein
MKTGKLLGDGEAKALAGGMSLSADEAAPGHA